MTTLKPNRRPNVRCDMCEAPIYRRPSTLRLNAKKTCSKRCRNKAYPLPDGRNFPPPKFGADNPAWKGGVTFFKTHGNYVGVKYVRAPQWAKPMARKDGYIMEHRLIMAEWCGFLMTRTEVVNHIDHDPTNNPRTNLELWPTNADHKRAEFGRCVPGVANRVFLKV